MDCIFTTWSLRVSNFASLFSMSMILTALPRIFVVGLLPFHRPELLDVLASKLPRDASVYFGKRLLSYSVSSGTDFPNTLEFKDGSTAGCHVVIGADGVHSATRKTMLELVARELEAKEGESAAASLREKIEPIWTGLTAYRTVANAGKLKALNPDHGGLTGPRVVSTMPLTKVNRQLMVNSIVEKEK